MSATDREGFRCIMAILHSKSPGNGACRAPADLAALEGAAHELKAGPGGRVGGSASQELELGVVERVER